MLLIFTIYFIGLYLCTRLFFKWSLDLNYGETEKHLLKEAFLSALLWPILLFTESFNRIINSSSIMDKLIKHFKGR